MSLLTIQAKLRTRKMSAGQSQYQRLLTTLKKMSMLYVFSSPHGRFCMTQLTFIVRYRHIFRCQFKSSREGPRPCQTCARIAKTICKTSSCTYSRAWKGYSACTRLESIERVLHAKTTHPKSCTRPTTRQCKHIPQ